METGDPYQLTIKEAREMMLVPDLMAQVPGVLPEDLQAAREREAEQDVFTFKQSEDLLRQYGADDESLAEKNLYEQFRLLLDAASVRGLEVNHPDRNSLEIVKNEAIRKIAVWLLINEEATYRLFETIQLDTPQGFRDVQVLDTAMDHIKYLFKDGDNNARVVLEEFMDIAERMQGMSFSDESLFLGAAYLSTLLAQESGKVVKERLVNNDNFVPFEITKGTYAVFSEDGDKIFIADESLSEDIKAVIGTAWTKEFAGPEGHDLPSYDYQYIPENLVDLSGSVLDGGDLLDDYLKQQGIIATPEDIYDYVTLLQGPLRREIEEKFGFRLTRLSISEQFYFLNYLKKVTVADAEITQDFMKAQGVPAMRSFLALAESEGVTGEDIVNFGNNLGDSARDVFGRYCEILDAVNEIDVWLASRVKMSPEEYAELKEQIESILMKNANQLLVSAIESGESADIQKQLDICQSEVRREVALLQSVSIDKLVSKPLEQTSATELAETDRARMRELVQGNYKNETPKFQALVAKSLEDHINDPNTNFYVLRNLNGLIISFNRFDKERDTETGELSRQYFGSFNADPVYFGVGSILMERTIKDQLDKCPVLYAHCDPRAKISQKYIEDGFIGTQTVSPAGKFSFEIWRTKNSSEKLKTKQMTPEALIAIAGETVPADFDYFIREVEPNDQFLELDAAFPFLLTRYFTVGSKTYAAFELNTELSRQFEIPLEKEQPVIPIQ